MKAYVIGSSALYYWRHALGSKRIVEKYCTRPLSECHASASELGKLLFPNSRYGSDPIHLMVPSADLRSKRKCYQFAVHSSRLPKTAFCSTEPDICVASPEFCLLQAARALSLFQLIELTMELCGLYTLDNEAPRGFISRKHQLTNVSKILDFSRQMKGEQGVKKLRQALLYAKGRSRSPMETRMHILSCLPKRFGSYGLPRPELNVRIDLTHDEQLYAKRSYLEADMHWKVGRVIIEYDGEEDHSAKEDRGRDAAKRNILMAKGYSIFVVTSKQICDSAAFDILIRDIARKLNYQLRSFPQGWEARQESLRREVFRSMIEGEKAFVF